MSNQDLIDDFRKPWLKIRVEDICIDGQLCFKGNYDRINVSTRVETEVGTHFYDIVPNDTYSQDETMTTYVVNISCRSGTKICGSWVFDFVLTAKDGLAVETATGSLINKKQLYVVSPKVADVEIDYGDTSKPRLKLTHNIAEPDTIVWVWDAIKSQF